jgi:hypothetical protein
MPTNTDDAVRRLTATLDPSAILDEILQALRRENPTHSRMSENLRSTRVVPAIGQIMLRADAALTEGKDVPLEAIELIAETARQRAIEGMPLEEILKGYRVAMRIAMRHLRQNAEPGDDAALVLLAERGMAFLDVATAAAIRGYFAERTEVVAERERSTRQLIAVLDGRVEAGPGDPELAHGYSLSIGAAFRPFVVGFRGDAGRHSAAAEAWRTTGVLAVSEGDRVVGLLSIGAEPPDPSESHVLAVGIPTAAGGVEPSLRTLRAAVAVAVRNGLTGRVTPADVALDVLLELWPDLAELLEQSTFEPLPPELRRTLEVLEANDFDRRRTAEEMKLHRNSISYRISQIEQLIDRDLSKSGDAASVVLANRARRARYRRPRLERP